MAIFLGRSLSQNYYSSETHGWLSPATLLVITLLAETAFLPAGRPHGRSLKYFTSQEA